MYGTIAPAASYADASASSAGRAPAPAAQAGLQRQQRRQSSSASSAGKAPASQRSGLFRCTYCARHNGRIKNYNRLPSHHHTRGGSKGGRGGRAPSPQKFQPCFFLLHGQKFQPCFFAAWHACSARLTFDQRTVYVLSTARVSRSVSSQVHAICVTAGR